MPSGKRRGLMLPSILALAMPGLPGCVSAPPIRAIPAACSSLLPETWAQGVPGAPLPVGDMIGDWIAFGDAQTAQLDKANGRTADAIGIVSRCEERDRAAVVSAGKRWWQIWK